MNTPKSNPESSEKGLERRKAMTKLGKYAVGGSAAMFSLSARSMSTTNCGVNGEENPSEGSGGNSCLDR